jgi:hypothetical protein
MELRKICQCSREDDSHSPLPTCFSNMQGKIKKEMNQAEYLMNKIFLGWHEFC